MGITERLEDYPERTPVKSTTERFMEMSRPSPNASSLPPSPPPSPPLQPPIKTSGRDGGGDGGGGDRGGGDEGGGDETHHVLRFDSGGRFPGFFFPNLDGIASTGIDLIWPPSSPYATPPTIGDVYRFFRDVRAEAASLGLTVHELLEPLVPTSGGGEGGNAPVSLFGMPSPLLLEEASYPPHPPPTPPSPPPRTVSLIPPPPLSSMSHTPHSPLQLPSLHHSPQ